MGAVAAGAILVAVLLLIVAGFLVQASRRGGGRSGAVYLLDEAASFVHARLSPGAAERLTPLRVRQILEWQIQYQQVVAPRSRGEHPVVGSGEAMEHVLAMGGAIGVVLEPLDVAEVMAAEVDYLLSIGAVGTPVEST